MKLALALPTPVEKHEGLRFRDNSEMRPRVKSARNQEQFRDRLKLRVRKTFVFLFVGTLALTIFWNRCQLFNGAFTVVHHMSARLQTVGDTASLRQNTLSYEKQVDEVALQNPADTKTAPDPSSP
jgi:hypothetical protein